MTYVCGLHTGIPRISFLTGLFGSVPLTWFLLGLYGSLDYPSFLDYLFVIFPIMAITFGAYSFYKVYPTLDRVFGGIGFLFGLISIIFQILI